MIGRRVRLSAIGRHALRYDGEEELAIKATVLRQGESENCWLVKWDCKRKHGNKTAEIHKTFVELDE